MSEFLTLRPALVAIAKSITGLTQAVWEQQKRPYVIPTGARAIALLSFGAVVGIGRDEVIPAFDADAELSEEDILNGEGEFTFMVAGNRRIPWRIKVDSYDQGDDATAWTYLENARTGLSWPSTLEALIAANVAIISVGEVQDLQVPENERVVSRAFLDIILGARFSREDPVKNTYIDTIAGTMTLDPRPPEEYST